MAQQNVLQIHGIVLIVILMVISMLRKIDPIFVFVIIAVIGVLLASYIRPGKIQVKVVILSIVIWKFQVVLHTKASNNDTKSQFT